MAGTDSHTSRTSGSDMLRQRRAQDQKMWSDMLAMINKATPQTMLGFGLGKLLRGAWDHSRERAAEKLDIEKQGRETLGRNSVARAGIAPVKGVLGNGFDMQTGFQAGTGGWNPIALEAYGKTINAQQPSSDSPVVAKTTEYVFDPNQQSVVQAAQGMPTTQAQQPMNLTERASQQVQQSMIQPWNLNDWWEKQLSREYLNQGRQG